MKEPHQITSACRYCRYYCPEGRRGGMCSQLGVQVQANWKSCSFAVPPFMNSWDKLQEIVLLENSLNLSEENQKIVSQEEVTETKAISKRSASRYA